MAGKALAASLRDGKSQVVMCAAHAFGVAEYVADRIVFTNDVPRGLRQRISAAHGIPADVPGMSSLVEAISRGVTAPDDVSDALRDAFSPRKRRGGWPKGKPRKKVA